jgi:hypothetical protein
VGDLDRTRAVTASSAGVSAVDQVRKSDTFHDRDRPSRGCNSALRDADGPPGFLWSGSGRGSPIGCVRSTGLGRVRVESVHLRGGGSRLWIPAWDCWVPITESFRNERRYSEPQTLITPLRRLDEDRQVPVSIGSVTIV